MTDETQSRLSARELAAEYATGTVFDITECAREPIHLASGHEKIRVCGQLAPGSRSSEFQSCGHLRSVWLAMCSLPVSGVS